MLTKNINWFIVRSMKRPIRIGEELNDILEKIKQGVTMKLVKVAVRTDNGLIVECELKPKTIEELKKNNFVYVEIINGGRK